MPTATIAPEISPPGRCAQQKQQAAGGADDQRLEHAQDFGAARAMAEDIDVGIRLTPPYGKSARRDKCAHAMQQCAALLPWLCAPHLLNAG